MNHLTPINITERDIRNAEVNAQSKKWDVENHFLEFGQALDTLDLITDGLADDPKISNALGAIHKTLCKVYSESKMRLFSP